MTKIQQTVRGLLFAGVPYAALAAGVGDDVHDFHIASEDGVNAVRDFGLQTGVAISAASADLNGKTLNAVTGKLTVDDALGILLKGTGLKYIYDATGKAITLQVAYVAVAKADATPPPPPPQPHVEVPREVKQTPVLLEEIIVTGRKREEALHDIPLSDEVFQGNQLSQAKLLTLQDIGEYNPSFTVTPTEGRSGALTIRGFGSGVGVGFDQAVGTYVDDIYHGRTPYTLERILDVDRVEVLKGPQSTFFGNSASAGAINQVTAKPDADFASSLRALYGSYGQYQAAGMVNIPITEDLRVRGAVLADGENGWLENVVDGQHFPHNRNIAARLKTLYQTENLTATLRIDGQHIQTTGLSLTLDGCPPPAPFVASGFCNTVDRGVPQGLGNHTAETPGQKADLDTHEEALTLRYLLGANSALTSVTGFTAYHYKQNLDVAGTPTPEITTSTPEVYSQFSQELRIESVQQQPLEYTAGLYFQSDALTSDTDIVFSFLPVPPIGQDTNYKQHEHIASAFASGTWHVTDPLAVTVGVRAQQVDKSYDWHLFYGQPGSIYGNVTENPAFAPLPMHIGLGNIGAFSGSRKDHGVDPSVHLKYAFSDRLMAYALYDRDFKAGGFNAGDNSAVPANLPFAPEHVDAYELGLKWQGAWGWINGGVFDETIHQRQVTTNLPTIVGGFTSIIGNAAVQRSIGAELGLKVSVLSNFDVISNVAFLQSKYLDYKNANPTLLQATAFGARIQDFSGTQTPNSPRWAGNVSVVYNATLPGGYKLRASVTEIGSATTYSDVSDVNRGQFFRLDNGLSFETPSGNWTVDFIGQNLADKRTVVVIAPQATATGSVLQNIQPPRSVAVQVTRKW